MNTDFFRDEVRCGFYIPTAIKQAWAADLKVLSELDRICRKHGISYFANWGTLLGCVRHEGYVPWDDDLDVGMKREDYIRFREVAKSELPEGYELQDFRNTDDHWLFITRICNKNHICFEEDHLNRFYNFPYIAGLDIFVLDYLYRDEEHEKQRDEEIKRILAVADGIIDNSIRSETKERELAEFERKYKIKFPETDDARQLGVALYELAEKQMGRVRSDDSDSVGQIFPWVLKGRPGLPKSYYERFLYLPFENTTMPVPYAYHRMLRDRYGDYLQAKKVWDGHSYPYFEGQKKNLEEVLGGKLPEYEFDRSVLAEEKMVKSSCLEEAGKILLLAAGPIYWEGFEKIYHSLQGEFNSKKITVVALPVLFKNALGQVTNDSDAVDASAHLEQYPKDVKFTEWWDYDIRKEGPDLVLIQDPYDEQNPCVTIPKEYYTRIIRRYAGRVIYIPPFGDRQDDFEANAVNDVYNLKHYALSPGVVYSDLVLVTSETIRKRYIKKLIEWAGADTKDYWERKIQVRDAFLYGARKNIEEIYEGSDAQHQPKRRLLYLIGINEFCEIGEDLDKAICNRLEIIRENEERIETSICFYPEQEDEWKRLDASLWERVKETTRQIISRNDNERIIFYAEAKRQISQFDAYYGSASPLVIEFARMKKPVMIADYEI